MANTVQMTMEQGPQATLTADSVQTFQTERPDEGIRLYHNRILDELPGAAFAVTTLVWVISSFGRLIW